MTVFSGEQEFETQMLKPGQSQFWKSEKCKNPFWQMLILQKQNNIVQLESQGVDQSISLSGPQKHWEPVLHIDLCLLPVHCFALKKGLLAI